MAYHDQPKETRIEMLKSYRKTTLENQIFELCGSDSCVSDILRELVPEYCRRKLEADFICCTFNTNETGKKISISVFSCDIFSIELIANICAAFDLLNCSVSNDWDPFIFSKNHCSALKEGKEILKYSFISENNTENTQYLAEKNISINFSQ